MLLIKLPISLRLRKYINIHTQDYFSVNIAMKILQVLPMNNNQNKKMESIYNYLKNNLRINKISQEILIEILNKKFSKVKIYNHIIKKIINQTFSVNKMNC